jgi:hypothetical protein
MLSVNLRSPSPDRARWQAATHKPIPIPVAKISADKQSNDLNSTTWCPI